jgi:hypothetical protein
VARPRGVEGSGILATLCYMLMGISYIEGLPELSHRPPDTPKTLDCEPVHYQGQDSTLLFLYLFPNLYPPSTLTSPPITASVFYLESELNLAIYAH